MIQLPARFIKGIRGTNDILEDGIPQIAFVGRSNVGKSSLINNLVDQRDLVRVGKKPGKTTEINFFLVNNKVYFVDLPGYGFARASLEEREKTRKMILWYLSDSGVKPRTIVVVIDSNIGITPLDRDMLDVLRGEKHNAIIVANKIDKISVADQPGQLSAIQAQCPGLPVLPYSTTRKRGRDELLQRLLS